jgi:hypothetical protein
MGSGLTVQPAVSYLVAPDTVIEANGEGPALELGGLAGRLVMIVLRITEIIEQQSLQVSVWGSPDGTTWGEKPLFSYPQKFYCGVTPAAIDLRQRPELRFLQARWEVNRWGRGYPRPHFKIAMEVQELATG